MSVDQNHKSGDYCCGDPGDCQHKRICDRKEPKKWEPTDADKKLLKSNGIAPQ